MNLAIALSGAFCLFFAVWFVKLCIKHWPRVDGKLQFSKLDYFMATWNVLAISAFVWMVVIGKI